MARHALLHPAIASPSLRDLLVPLLSPPDSPQLPLTPSVIFALESPKCTQINEVHSMMHAPRPALRRFSTRQNRLRWSVQIHALYILAIRAWPRHRHIAEQYWTGITKIAELAGGPITRDADDLVLRAAHRLDHANDDSWKFAKLKKKDQSASCEFKDENAGRGQKKQLVNPKHESESALSGLMLESGSPTGPMCVSSLIDDRQTPGYPSPPPTPNSSPPSLPDTVSSDQPVSLIEKQVRRKGSNASFQPPRLLRRVASSTSISTVPPNFGRPRALGPSALGGSFVTTVGKSAVEGIAPRPLPIRSVTSPLAQEVQPVASHWTTGIRQRLLNLRLPRARPRQVDTVSTAQSVLRDLIERDDASAGPGMRWATLQDLEAEEEDVLQDVAAKSGQQACSLRGPPPPPPILPRQRSFIDPTTPSRIVSRRQVTPDLTKCQQPVPEVVCTPATPQKDHLLPPRPLRRRRAGSKSSAAALPPMDPFLAELERKSRVGVKATCHECGLIGLNYSACPRCMKKYCTRECRIKSGGGRHRC